MLSGMPAILTKRNVSCVRIKEFVLRMQSEHLINADMILAGLLMDVTGQALVLVMKSVIPP